jgi:hypothetical protein
LLSAIGLRVNVAAMLEVGSIDISFLVLRSSKISAAEKIRGERVSYFG